MRPRFSIKWLLALFVLFAGILYWAAVRPTILAKSLIATVKGGNITAVTSLVPFDELGQIENPSWKFGNARIEPRTWNDVWRCRRRFSMLLTRNPPLVDTAVLEISASPSGYFVDKVINGQSAL